ncbi:MAG: flagellar protein FlgN [Oscillospiraceae bacterium]|jgi:hypothetical protein|nr:flagellar protein FlgN [Oscillospiraceae bacterium]
MNEKFKSLSNDTALPILDFMERYGEHFKEQLAFLSEKQEKVTADDINWLLGSLSEEEKHIMKGNSLEGKRLELMKQAGLEGANSKELLEVFPEELRGRLRCSIDSIEAAIYYIKDANRAITEMIERKLEIQRNLFGTENEKPPSPFIVGGDTYTAKGSRVHKPPDDETGTFKA